MKNSNFPLGKTMIFTKSAFSKKYRKMLDFGSVLGGQIHEKSRKIHVEKNIFLRAFFNECLTFSPLIMEPTSMFFDIFFENVDFVKIIVFLKENCYFSGFELPKNYLKSMPKRIRKKHRKKTSQKSILASVLVSQNRPKSAQHRKKLEKIAFKKKLKKRLHATWAAHRKSSLLGSRRTIQPPFQ